MLSLLLWWLLIEFLGLLALPLALALFRHLPDRGYPFARVLGILLPAFLAWLLGMWQLATYGRGLLFLCLIVVAGLSGVVAWKDRSVLQFLRERWKLLVLYELLFAVALLAGAVLRILGPWGGAAINHTEQPMDFAFMNGIIRSHTLPPQDPWLAGFGINYYYLGYFLAASLTLLSGLPSSLAFSLNLALLFALAITGCFSLGYNLTVAIEPPERRRLFPASAIIAGTLAALFAAVVGNQAGALQLLTGSNQVVALNAGELASVLRARLLGERGPLSLGYTVDTSDDTFNGAFDTIAPTAGRQVGDFDWWLPSRVLWDERPSAEALERIRNSGQVGAALFNWRRLVSPDEVERTYNITEVPFFSFYLGDMHPHVMALPLTLAAMALALNIVLSPERGRPALGPGKSSWFLLALSAVLLGGLYMANSWDFPTCFLLYAAAWVWRWRKGAAGRSTRQDWGALARDLGLLAGLCLLLYLPFFLTFRSPVGSKDIPDDILQVPVVGTIARLPFVSKLLQTAGPVLWDKSSLHTILILFGLFLYPALSWLLARWFERRRGELWTWLGPAIALLIALALAVLLRFPLLLLIPLFGMGWHRLRAGRPAEAMAMLMLLLALLLLFACEIVYIRDVFESRMNTIFKFYYQVWMLLAIVAAFAIGQAGRSYLRRPVPFALWCIPLLLLLAGGLVYPASALRSTVQGGRPAWTLDGLDYMRKQHPNDYAGIQWLWKNVPPGAVVLEEVGPEWGYYGRVSAATGLPTLLGWDGHEAQWRGGQPLAYAEIGIRQEAARRLFETTDAGEARQLLRQYGVDYVFLGGLEAGSTVEARAKFAQLGTLVFEEPGIQIYRIPEEPGITER